jgi:putative ABC transport system substrate-binding protein
MTSCFLYNRREFITLLGSAAAAWPLGARAEQRGRLWRIGFLSARSEPASLETDAHGEFIKGMRDFGYVEGKDFSMEWRFAAGKFGHMTASDLCAARQMISCQAGAIHTCKRRPSTSS